MYTWGHLGRVFWNDCSVSASSTHWQLPFALYLCCCCSSSSSSSSSSSPTSELARFLSVRFRSPESGKLAARLRRRQEARSLVTRFVSFETVERGWEKKRRATAVGCYRFHPSLLNWLDWYQSNAAAEPRNTRIIWRWWRKKSNPEREREREREAKRVLKRNNEEIGEKSRQQQPTKKLP